MGKKNVEVDTTVDEAQTPRPSLKLESLEAIIDCLQSLSALIKPLMTTLSKTLWIRTQARIKEIPDAYPLWRMRHPSTYPR